MSPGKYSEHRNQSAIHNFIITEMHVQRQVTFIHPSPIYSIFYSNILHHCTYINMLYVQLLSVSPIVYSVTYIESKEINRCYTCSSRSIDVYRQVSHLQTMEDVCSAASQKPCTRSYYTAQTVGPQNTPDDQNHCSESIIMDSDFVYLWKTINVENMTDF